MADTYLRKRPAIISRLVNVHRAFNYVFCSSYRHVHTSTMAELDSRINQEIENSVK